MSKVRKSPNPACRAAQAAPVTPPAGPESRSETGFSIAAAGEERLVDNAGSRKVAARCPSARFVEVPGAYHEILQELDVLQAPFWAEFDARSAKLGAG